MSFVHYGKVSGAPCFSGENHRKSRRELTTKVIINYYTVVFLARQGPLCRAASWNRDQMRKFTFMVEKKGTQGVKEARFVILHFLYNQKVLGESPETENLQSG